MNCEIPLGPFHGTPRTEYTYTKPIMTKKQSNLRPLFFCTPECSVDAFRILSDMAKYFLRIHPTLVLHTVGAQDTCSGITVGLMIA